MSNKVILAYQSTKDKPPHPLLLKREAKYKVYNLIPDRFIQDGKIIEDILTSISALLDNPISFQNKSLVYNPQQPIFYELFYDNDKVSFNYAIPEQYEAIMTNKIKSIYSSATLKPVEKDYYEYFNGKHYCSFKQKKHFMFSLNVDYRENALIEAFINFISNIQQNDKLLFQIGILPQDENWKNSWKETYKRYKSGENIDIQHDIPSFILDNTFKLANSLLKVMDMVVGVKVEAEKKEERILEQHDLESHRHKRMTLQKLNYTGYQVQFRLYCDSAERIYYYTKIFEGIFKLLDADQELEMTKHKTNTDNERKYDFQLYKNIFSKKELSIFMQMPNRRMQIEFKKHLDSVETRETQVPKTLLDKNGIPMGTYIYKGERYPTYFPSDKDNANYSILATGFQRVGKTSAMENYAVNTTLMGHTNFVIDTIRGCEMSNNIRNYMPESHKHKIIVLDYSNEKYMLPLAWNEVNMNDGTMNQKLKKASILAGMFQAFLDVHANDDQEKLSPNMKKYLSSAIKLVLQHNDTNINDVITCLIDYNTRHKFIERSGMKADSKTILDMVSLDTDEKGVKGTAFNQIKGIIDRVSPLYDDYAMELFLNVPNNNKINFVDWMTKGYCVIIKLPENDFSPVAVNTLVTFMFCKIWLSVLASRKGDFTKLPPVHIIADEIHKYPLVTKLLYNWVRESAKYKVNYFLSCHILNDLKYLLPAFKGAGSHYMVFKSSPQNYKMLENELLPFTLEELMELKPFHPVNVINYNRDYSVFITESLLPLYMNEKYKYVDREYLDEKCSKELGFEYEE